MKKWMIAGGLLLAVNGVFAQGPQKPPPPEDRWKHDSKIIAEKASLDASATEKMKPAFMAFYKEMDAVMKKYEEARPKKEEIDPVVKKRNDALKAVLKESQFQSFIKMEKELGPRPPGKDMPPPHNN